MGGKRGQIKNQIRCIRLARTDWTQADLAKRVGATRQTIIAIEAGKYAPSMVLAFRIAKAFGVSFDEVFQFEE
jgi:putative transcriptional regulator